MVFRAKRITFFLVNRVENQNERKRPQSSGRLGSFWFSTRPTAMGGTDYNILGLWDNLRSGRLGSFWFSTRFTRKKVIRLARKTV